MEKQISTERENNVVFCATQLARNGRADLINQMKNQQKKTRTTASECGQTTAR